MATVTGVTLITVIQIPACYSSDGILHMLYECRHTIGPNGPLSMRWFHDSYFDLDIWIDEDGTVDSFLLSYGKPVNEHALSWRREGGYLHYRVDDGEGRPGKHKSAPILLADGVADIPRIAARFIKESSEMEPRLAEFVLTALRTYPRHPHRASL